jgi:hypothetical protein
LYLGFLNLSRPLVRDDSLSLNLNIHHQMWSLLRYFIYKKENVVPMYPDLLWVRGLKFELYTLCLGIRCSITWATSPVLSTFTEKSSTSHPVKSEFMGQIHNKLRCPWFDLGCTVVWMSPPKLLLKFNPFYDILMRWKLNLIAVLRWDF